MTMEFVVDMTAWGALALVVGAIVIGIVAQLIGDARFRYEWVATAIGAFVAALVASEFVTAWATVEPVWEGVALWPAIIAGIIGGAVVAIVVRYATGGSMLHGPHPA
jgi:hypothetical protein